MEGGMVASRRYDRLLLIITDTIERPRSSVHLMSVIEECHFRNAGQLEDRWMESQLGP